MLVREPRLPCPVKGNVVFPDTSPKGYCGSWRSALILERLGAPMVARYKVGIVGGSIGGCATAIGLSRLGHEVVVFERSTGGLVSRGAGIATPASVIESMVSRDLVDSSFPRLPAGPLQWVSSDESGVSSRVLGVDPVPLPWTTLTWTDLFEHLRRRVPHGTYRLGAAVSKVHEDAGSPAITLADGSEHSFDLVVCADGYRSLGRSTLFPSAIPRYRGYILWRGMTGMEHVHDGGLLESGPVRVGYRGGHGLFYLVPGSDAHVERRVNWGLYLQVPEGELASVLTDRLGAASEGSVAAGMVPAEREAEFRHKVSDALPRSLADVVGASDRTFIQAIFSVEVPAYSSGRLCLVGDAGSLFPPFTGSGVFKAINNAVELTDAIASSDTIDAALTVWNDGQLAHAATFHSAARVLEEAFILSVPDLRSMSAEEFSVWNRDVWSRAFAGPARDS